MTGDRGARLTAVLGPTNTGKTHYAIERMLGHRTGVIGLPLRLLAREVYDRVVALRGAGAVALITGEERIQPARPAYWVCTVEAMPLEMGTDFLAVDEIQLAADPDRGHVFTDRLLHARGRQETLVLGAETMRPLIQRLFPDTIFLTRSRLSQLRYTGAHKISRIPPRSAIVGFSVDDVYAIAELIRRQKGGAAVVMGALSPRTRNAQVALYQNGDVDFMVATDAIGMGLNLDIRHVAFAGLSKFDGRRHRPLLPNELSQIAGRAGRHMRDGTFGVTGEARPLQPDVVEAIEAHRFQPVERLQWRNSRLDFATPARLMASLDMAPPRPELARAREADDQATLSALIGIESVRARIRTPADTRLLWDVCQIPDFRKVSPTEHATLCARLFGFLHDGGRVPADWLGRQIARIDRTEGDIDTLARRLAFIRTWTYAAQRRGWVDDAEHWKAETRAVEDRLSDALHARLTQRFVDRRTSVLMRRLKQKETLVAEVTDSGEVRVDDQFIGRLEGFRFRLDGAGDAAEARTLRAAGIAALAQALTRRADRFYNAPDTDIEMSEQGGLLWGGHLLGKLVKGPDALSPGVQVFVDPDAPEGVAERVERRLVHWLDRRIRAQFEPLIALRDDPAVTGLARGVGFRLVEALGVLPRAEVAADVKALEQEGRAQLRRHGVRFGQFTLFQPAMLKPAPTRLRLVLWALDRGLDEVPPAPTPGLVTVPAAPDLPEGYWPRAGYRRTGARAIRIDMLERLADMIRDKDAQSGFEATADMLSITGLSLEQFADLMQGMGYVATRGTREKQRGPAGPVAAAARPDRRPRVTAAVPTPAGTGGPADGAPALSAQGTAAAAARTEAPGPGAPATPAREALSADAAPADTPLPDAPTAAQQTPVADSDPGGARPAPPASGAGSAADAAPAGAGGRAAEEAAERSAAADPSAPAAAAQPAPPGGAPADAADADAGAEAAEAAGPGPGRAETVEEVFFVFTRAPRRRDGASRARRKPGGHRALPAAEGEGPKKPGRGRPPRKGAKGLTTAADPSPRANGARPERSDRIDPDSPFAALAVLKRGR